MVYYLEFETIDAEKIIDILIHEGKQTLGDQVKSGALSFLNFIFTDSYFLTTLDLWLLVDKYEIPSIFISSKVIPETRFKYKEFVCYKNVIDDIDKNKFVFIIKFI